MKEQAITHVELLTIREAADRVKVHPNTIRNEIMRGHLAAIRLGARIVRGKSADVDALFTQYQPGEYGNWARANVTPGGVECAS